MKQLSPAQIEAFNRAQQDLNQTVAYADSLKKGAEATWAAFVLGLSVDLGVDLRKCQIQKNGSIVEPEAAPAPESAPEEGGFGVDEGACLG